MGLIKSLTSALRLTGGGRINVDRRFVHQRTAATGTMSQFFVAQDREHDNRIVGVKIIDVEKMKHFEARFKGLNKPTEGQIAISMKHPQIAQTYEIGVTTKGEPIMVMEYVAGPGMQHIIVKKLEDLVAGKRMKLIRDMADALQYVHSREYIHRDICPRNFICEPNMTGAKLIDFGLSVPATEPFMVPGNRTGTPLYMSPEVVRRRSTDKRVDIFSFGVTCYCLCAFEHPWPGNEVSGRAALHHDTSPPVDLIQRCPKIDRRLSRAIMHALNPNVDERTASMDQFLEGTRSVDSAFV